MAKLSSRSDYMSQSVPYPTRVMMTCPPLFHKIIIYSLMSLELFCPAGALTLRNLFRCQNGALLEDLVPKLKKVLLNQKVDGRLFILAHPSIRWRIDEMLKKVSDKDLKDHVFWLGHLAFSHTLIPVPSGRCRPSISPRECNRNRRALQIDWQPRFCDPATLRGAINSIRGDCFCGYSQKFCNLDPGSRKGGC